MPDISIATPDHALPAYLATPVGEGPWPGVVVLHDAWGLTPDTRRHADTFASAGYLAVAPSLYAWRNKLICLQTTIRDLLTRKGPAFADIEATRAGLAARPDCTGRVGVIGFCMGGGFALVLAADRGFSASSINYGMIPGDVETLLKGACPVIGSFGAKDGGLKGAAARLEGALRRNSVPHDVKEYAEAGHGFMNAHTGTAGWVMARTGMSFHEPSAADSQARILAFFHEHLGEKN